MPLISILVLCLCGASLCYSQADSVAENQLIEVNKIVFQGNETFGGNELKEVIQCAETPNGFSKFLYRTIGEKLGSKPEYFDLTRFEEDQERLVSYYRDKGFYNAVVSGNFQIDSNRYRVDLVFLVQENKRSVVDTVVYRGLENLSQELQVEIYKEPIIQKGMLYETDKAAAENARILRFLWNNGYPLAKFDDERSSAQRYLSSNNFFLTFVFNPGKKNQFGDINLDVDPPREDITNELIIRHLDFQRDEVYSREKLFTSERNLNRLGLFESARIDHHQLMDSGSTSMPIRISVRPRPRNELSPEFVISDEGGFFNIGLGLGYANRNFFGNARTFSARTRVRTQDIQTWNLGEVFGGQGFRDPTVKGAIELQFNVVQPYVFTRSMSGSWTSSLSAEKQKEYILAILRNKMGISNQFALYTYGSLEWTLERVSPEILEVSSTSETFLSTLRQEDQPQFNSILTATLQRDKTNDIFSPTDGFFHSITLEESGILPKLLPGIRSGLPFTQYYKVTLLGRWYEDLTVSRYNILAIKARTGYQDKYGESKTSDVSIPLNRRFFSGGSGSVRGWKARELGAMPDSLIPFGGNFILEANLEMRVHYFRGFGKFLNMPLDHIWGVYFLDIGNTWRDISDFKPKDIAIAAGIGFRYETFFGPFRIDYGFPVYNPKEIPGGQSIFQRRFFAETLSSGVFHFGIGHAF
ncbi:MAG TPA: BamA/TamA family outer membrane protein [Bacteroidota bacterium]|nr:BamA/TamA family outer membrane protein [Bacteroidota bacterium]